MRAKLAAANASSRNNSITSAALSEAELARIAATR
jgi:hypothetical protein